MLTIRFARVGKKNKPQYKIALQEKTAAPGGRHVEILGSYDPHSKQTVLKEDRIKYWLEKGAQLSDTVHNLFVSKGIISEKKKAVKIPEKKVEAGAEGATEEKKVEIPKVEEKTPEVPVEAEKPAVQEEPKAEEKKAEEAPKEEPKKE